MRHTKWKNSIVAMFDELEAWEIKNVGQKQFSQCFELFVEHIDSVLEVKQELDQDKMLQNSDLNFEEDQPALSKSGQLEPIDDVDEISENQ